MWEGKYWKRQLCLLAGPRGSAGPQFYLRGTEGEQKEKEKHNLVWFITSLFLLMLQSPELFNDKPLYLLSNNTKLTVYALLWGLPYTIKSLEAAVVVIWCCIN